MATPPLGNRRPYFTMTCGYGVDPLLCDAPATWHLIWDETIEHSLACDKHRVESHRRWTVYDEHPITEVCTVPDSSIVWSWEDEPGYCQWVVGDETLAAVEAAMLAPVGGAR